jgi:phage terminase Nu1 subunit (DNA packaging protein)
MTLGTIRANALRSLIPPPRLRLSEWSGVLRTVRAGMLAVPSRAAQRLPHLSAHDVAEIDAEVRAALVELK